MSSKIDLSAQRNETDYCIRWQKFRYFRSKIGLGKNYFEVLNLAEAMKRLKITFSPDKPLCLLRTEH